MRLTAYVLAIESIAERAWDARDLLQCLEAYADIESAEFIPAVYWQDVDAIPDFLARHPQIRFTQEYLARCRLGQLGATAIHIQMWEKLLDSDFDGALVFEDDIYINDPDLFQQMLSALPKHPEIEFLRIHLYNGFRSQIFASADEGLFVDDPSEWGFAAYYVSRQAAEKLLQRFLLIDDHVDMIIPLMAKSGQLQCKTVRQVMVEHHPFKGAADELDGRHETEKSSEKLQKAASTIWTSQRLLDYREFHDRLSGMTAKHLQQLRDHGHTTLKNVIRPSAVEGFRQQILQNRRLFKNTRSSSSALHLAGFHRFPELESLHTQLTGNRVMRRFLEYVLQEQPIQSLGLSDITISRSQPWHKDLLRGKFRQYLQEQDEVWGRNGGGVFKVLFYLQAVPA